MFYEWRGVQGSKGNVYPHPVQDQISSQRTDQVWRLITLENEFIEVSMIPALGGRIYTATDKTNGYDFLYRHQVIKPALIGTFGPWISGGIEFNWPQHHRPSTYDPTNYALQEHDDGSLTVWMGEHEPLNRTKGMVGVTLYPGKALIETKVRLYNRAMTPQSFLWWANAGVPINEQYQVIFPPDVRYAVYHGKAPVISFPIGTGEFPSGNDYGDGTDISYWANSPGATSFFSAPSRYHFFGGYDHVRGVGIVHVANAGISGGKKYFTWANGPYGHTWQRNLYDYDTEGEYLELMAGVYSDNQPDFSWIMPYETRTFSQFWYPVQAIGGLKNANQRTALNLELVDGKLQLAAYATERLAGAHLRLIVADKVVLDERADLAPGVSWTRELEVPSKLRAEQVLLVLSDAQGAEVLRYQLDAPSEAELPEPYKAAPWPDEVETVDELYLIGLHHLQYHSTLIDPELYWEEALRRDPGDARCNLGMGKLALQRGELVKAEGYLRAAIARQMLRNYNPYDGEALYFLALVLQLQGQTDEAYRTYYKATWNQAWQSGAYYRLAQLDCQRQAYQEALEHLERALTGNTQHNQAITLRCAILRQLGRTDEARAAAAELLKRDPLDYAAHWELAQATAGTADRALLGDDPQVLLDVAFDYAAAGFVEDADALLALAVEGGKQHPMLAYARADLALRRGDEAAANALAQAARSADGRYCFPWRLEEMQILERVRMSNPRDGRAAGYLGNLYYDKKRWREGVEAWRAAARHDPDESIWHRNLGLAAFNLDGDVPQALTHYRRALKAKPDDPRLVLEYDFIQQRVPVEPRTRLKALLKQGKVLEQREDLVLLVMSLYNVTGEPEKALELAASRSFHPWEGGEGAVAGQYANAHWLLGRQALVAGKTDAAIAHFTQGLDYPANLGEQAQLANAIRLTFSLGLAQAAAQHDEEARKAFQAVLDYRPTAGPSEVTLYRALATIRLGEVSAGETALRALFKASQQALDVGITQRYPAHTTNNPAFYEPPERSFRLRHLVLIGLAQAALGKNAEARSVLEEALAIDPANLSAVVALQELAGDAYA